MAFVLDASVVLAWHFRDEHWPAATEIARRATRDGVVVPSYLPLEVAAGLLRGERTGRTSRAAAELFLVQLRDLAIEHDGSPEAGAWDRLLPLAREHGLKMFDAGYLALAMDRNLPLASFDRALVRAAGAVGTAIVEP